MCHRSFRVLQRKRGVIYCSLIFVTWSQGKKLDDHFLHSPDLWCTGHGPLNFLLHLSHVRSTSVRRFFFLRWVSAFFFPVDSSDDSASWPVLFTTRIFAVAVANMYPLRRFTGSDALSYHCTFEFFRELSAFKNERTVLEEKQRRSLLLGHR